MTSATEIGSQALSSRHGTITFMASAQSHGCVCPVPTCGKYLNTAQGLKAHTTRLHSQLHQQPNASQTLPKHLDQPEGFLLSQDTDQDPSGTPHPIVSGSDGLGLFLAHRRSTIKIIRRLPKGARSAAAEALADTLDTCISENSFAAWVKVFCFAGSCFFLHSPEDSSKVSLATLVKKNILAFRAEMSSLPSPHPTATNKQGEPSSQKGHSTRIAGAALGRSIETRLAEGDVVGAVRRLCSEDTFAPMDSHTLQALKDIHPAHAGERDWPASQNLDVPNTVITEAMIKGAVSSFPAGSAGGLDLLSPQHVKDMTSPGSGNAGQRLLVSLARFTNFLLKGSVPQDICPIFYGASLCALKKKSGGIRPVAVGNTLRRLTAKVCCLQVNPTLGPRFQPFQLGFGTKCGAEAAAHSARQFIDYNHSSPKVFLKIDFRNAFNTVNRDDLLRAASEYMPNLSAFLTQSYRHPSFLFYGKDRILSQRGIQQGDPLGPALFCAVSLKIASHLKSELNLWYLDDGALGGTPETVADDLQTVIRLANDIGLELNFKKCELFPLAASPQVACHIRESFQLLAPGILFPEYKTCSLLGAPLVAEGIATAVDSKTQALARMATRLEFLSTHAAFYILKFSQAIPKLGYVLRVAPTWKEKNCLMTFDSTLKQALESVINSQMSTEAWLQSALPTSLGGLGMKHAADVALPAFLASATGVEHLTKTSLPTEIFLAGDKCVSEGKLLWQSLNPCCTLPNSPSQREWEGPSIAASRSILLERAPTLQDKARLLGVCSKEGGAFLNALPSPSLGTFLDNNSFRIAIALRLGTKICEPHTCLCGATVDIQGIHGLSCKKGAGRFARHSAVNDVIRRGLSSAGFPSVAEPSFLTSANNKRPDGVTQIPWFGGRSLAWDFTCPNPLASSYLADTSRIPLHAASTAELNKKRKYSFLGPSFLFAPIAVECLGSFGNESRKLLTTIGRKIAEASGESRAVEFFLQRISVAIQRGNAVAVMESIPKAASLENEIAHL